MFKDLIKKCRSTRGYDESYKLTREDLEELVDHARYASAAMNKQALKYYLVYEPDKVDLIQSLIKMGGALPELHLPFDGEHPTAFIVICHDDSVAKINNFFVMDVGIAAETIMLALADQGLSGCMIGAFSPQKVSEALSLAANLTPMLIIACGKGVETAKIVEIEEGESTSYYRDDQGTHMVPKRKLKDIIIN